MVTEYRAVGAGVSDEIILAYIRREDATQPVVSRVLTTVYQRVSIRATWSPRSLAPRSLVRYLQRTPDC